jgi:hypothetical protein
MGILGFLLSTKGMKETYRYDFVWSPIHHLVKLQNEPRWHSTALIIAWRCGDFFVLAFAVHGRKLCWRTLFEHCCSFEMERRRQSRTSPRQGDGRIAQLKYFLYVCGGEIGSRHY